MAFIKREGNIHHTFRNWLYKLYCLIYLNQECGSEKLMHMPSAVQDEEIALFSQLCSSKLCVQCHQLLSTVLNAISLMLS